jgi:hypothetical protein
MPCELLRLIAIQSRFEGFLDSCSYESVPVKWSDYEVDKGPGDNFYFKLHAKDNLSRHRIG